MEQSVKYQNFWSLVERCFSSLPSHLFLFANNQLWPPGNQYFNLSVQLESGVRLIQGQAHLDPNGTGQIRLCHFNCALIDGGTLDDYLLITKAWLEKNPHEGTKALASPCLH